MTFADNPEFRPFAPLAFHRLNTQRSMKALADLLKKTEVGSYESIKSADYLAESGDQQWFPLLQSMGVEHPKISNYVDDAADLGGEKMLPSLIELSHSSDREFTGINAVTAMGYTGSRSAAGTLVELLRNPDGDIRDRAQLGLRILTHHMAGANPYSNPPDSVAKWARWWAREGASAPIFKARECGELTLLP